MAKEWVVVKNAAEGTFESDSGKVSKDGGLDEGENFDDLEALGELWALLFGDADGSTLSFTAAVSTAVASLAMLNF